MKVLSTYGKSDHDIIEILKSEGLVPKHVKTNPISEGLIARRSVRLFTDDPVPDELLEAICVTAQWSACGRSNQGWIFQIVVDPWNVRLIDDALTEAFGRSPADHLGGATALILVGHRPGRPDVGRLLDDGCAGQNVLNAAHAYGVDSFWFSQFQGRSDVPCVRAALNEIGFPEDAKVEAAIALGYGVQEEINGAVFHRRKSKILWA